MAAPATRLAIDLSSDSVRVVEGAIGDQMRCGTAALQTGAAAGGKVLDPAAVARALKPLLARIEATQSRAFVAASDAVATFRVLRLPEAMKAADVDGIIARELPFDAQRMAVRWHDVGTRDGQRLVYAAAWDRALVKNIGEAVRGAGLEPAVIELKSASVARTVSPPSCLVVDLSSNPADIVLIDEHLPRVWHTAAAPEADASDTPAAVAAPLRSVLRFYRRHSGGEFSSNAPVFVSSEQVFPAQMMESISELVGQPVSALPAPPRVPANVRHSTYLACLGLLMRRKS